MTCQLSSTTAVLAAFGEAPPEFEGHLSECADCRATVQEHTGTLAVLDSAIHERPTSANPRWRVPVIGVLIAATALLAFQFTAIDPDPGRAALDSPAHSQATLLDTPAFESTIDEDLVSLEMELALFTLEES
jgi:hypothetical protein